MAGFVTPAAEKHSCRYLHTGMQASEFNNGRLLFDPKFRNFRNGDIWYGNFLGKVPENVEVVEFPKSEPLNRKFRKFRDENQMERTFPGKYVPKFGFTPQGCPLCLEILQIRDLLFSASCFGRDHSELDISRKDDGEVYPKMEVL